MTTEPELHYVHPGEILLSEFLEPLGISQNRLATELRVPAPRINAIAHGKRAITPDTALRLARYLGTTAEFWTNLQSHFDLQVETRDIADELDRIQPLVTSG